MKTNAEKKQMRLRAQVALALTLGMSILPAAALAETITTTKNYEENVTVTDDVDITNGAIEVTGLNNYSPSPRGDRTAILKGNVRIVNRSNRVLGALRRGTNTGSDFAGILIINPDRTKRVQLDGDIFVKLENTSHNGFVNLYLRGEDSYFAGGINGADTGELRRNGGVRLELSDGATWYPKKGGDIRSLIPTPITPVILAGRGGQRI